MSIETGGGGVPYSLGVPGAGDAAPGGVDGRIARDGAGGAFDDAGAARAFGDFASLSDAPIDLAPAGAPRGSVDAIVDAVVAPLLAAESA